MKEKLIEKLKEPKVKNKIIEITTELFKETWDAYNNLDRSKICEVFYPDYLHLTTPFFYPDDDDGFVDFFADESHLRGFSLTDNTDESFFEVASYMVDFYERLSFEIQNILSKEVIDKFESPQIITVKELYEVYEDLTVPTISLSRMNFEELYIIFVEKVRLAILGKYHSKFFEIGETFDPDENKATGVFADFTESEYENVLTPPKEVHLWGKNGISIRATATEDSPRMYASGMIIKIELCGCMSPNVFEHISKSLDTLVKTIERSLTLLSNINHMVYPYTEYLSLIDKFKGYLEDYFCVPGKKDTINRRIRNAVSLLIESDAQNNKAISTSLSIAAIEALLGEKGAEISERLSTNIAVLLEPDLNNRTAAEKFFKNLYNLRSRTLHGESLEDEERLSEKSRHLAAAVLDAVIARRDLLLKSGFAPDSPQDLLSELRAFKYRSGSVICDIKNYNVRCYWDDKDKDKEQRV